MLKYHIIESGYFMGDGGVMFGAVPKKYWSAKYKTDENNMCVMSMRCLFIETESRRILIDNGLGNKHNNKLKFFQPHNTVDIRDEIRKIGYEPEEVTDVIISHLHFDHCGGSTILNDDNEAVPAYPNATYHVSLKQWNNYRNNITQFVHNPARREIIERSLSTQTSGKSWEASHFENMPLAAAVTILTKIENDIVTAEGEALENILNSVDAGDFRVNQLNAYLIPESDIVFRGSNYRARVVLTAEDTTKQPQLIINSSATPVIEGNNSFTLPANTTGTFPIDGHLEISGNNGTVIRRDFQSSYTVIEPMATIAPSLMNVLYAGIENEVSISVPGISPQNISTVMTNGTVTRRGNMWYATPSQVGTDATITVTVTTPSGAAQQLTSREFGVRALPDPTPYIIYRDSDGKPVTFKGGSIAKSVLINADGIEAAIDDGILNIPFRVTEFRTLFFDSMGNAIPEVSDGSRFSQRQREQIRRLSRGSYFYISGIRAAGPDGVEREIAVIEVRVN
jgi:gliding motility-associated protein GldM